MNKIIYDDKTKVGILENKICPFRNPLILPGQIAGRFVIENIPCSSACALFDFNYKENEADDSVICYLYCRTETVKIIAKVETLNKNQIIK